MLRLNPGSVIAGGMLLAIATTACTATSSPSSVPPTPSDSSSVPSFSPSPVPSSSPGSESPSPEQDAIQVIRAYYRAIARRDYEQAYLAWEDNGAASQQSLDEFRQGFSNTSSVAVEVGEPGQQEGAAGSSYIEIPVTVTAVTRDGRPQRFRGSYVLRRVNDVPGSTADQRQWHIHSADINQVN